MEKAILIEMDYKGSYGRYALTPEEFRAEFAEELSGGMAEPGEEESFTLSPMVHMWYKEAEIGGELWENFFTDMEEGLPESDIENGNLAYISMDDMKSLKKYLPGEKENDLSDIKILSFEESHDKEYGNSLIQYQKGDAYVSFMFSDLDVTKKDLSIDELVNAVRDNLSEASAGPLWSALPEELLVEIILSDFDMRFIEYDDEDWNEELADKLFNEAVKLGIDNSVLSFQEDDCWLTFYAGAIGEVNWYGHYDFGRPYLEHSVNKYTFTVNYEHDEKSKSFEIKTVSSEKPDGDFLFEGIKKALYHTGLFESVEDAANAVSAIDIHIDDMQGEYVDSDELYGEDLDAFFEDLKIERYSLIVDGDIYYAFLTKKEADIVKMDIAGKLNRQFEITDETGEKIESGIIDSIEKIEKLSLDSKIESAKERAASQSIKPEKESGFDR